MIENNLRKLTILYGSQTGNAQDISERIWRESKRYYFTGAVKSMDDYDIRNLINEKCVIFVCSTTGQGEEPDNMKLFWKSLLRKNLPDNLLSNLQYSVLGLGDSSYVKFNFVAKRLNKRLLQLGADMILPLALGDDQHDMGYDAVVDVWIESLWKELLNIYPLADDKQPLNSNLEIIPRWKIETVENDVTNNQESIYFNDTVKMPQDQFLIEVEENVKITSPTHFQVVTRDSNQTTAITQGFFEDSFMLLNPEAINELEILLFQDSLKDVRLIKFKTHGKQYLPGDVLYVRPKNSKEQINEFYDILNTNGIKIKPELVYKISETDPDMPVPSYLQNNMQFQTLCEEYFDLSSIPRRYIFSVLAQITNSELEKEKCIEFTTAEGQNDLYNYCNRPKRNITEVLRDFPHAVENITIDMLFEILSPIKSRAFSIASSAKAHENQIHVLIAVVKYKTKLHKERLGLCSNWLANLNVGDKIPAWVKKGSFRFPYQENNPVIMVGPGTGVAPFRSYICEMNKLDMASANNLVLIFGCRQENHDFHCKDDFKQLEKDNKISLICAFSRDQENKVYVQHKIEEHGEKFYELLQNKNACIFVAGNSKNMPDSVKQAFRDVVMKYKQITLDEAEQVITNLERTGRYQTETWA